MLIERNAPLLAEVPRRRGQKIMSPELESSPLVGKVEEWIVQARGGSGEALGRLLEMCRRYLLLMANQDLPSELRAKVAPSDMVQDTLMEAGRDFLDFQGATVEELLGWLRRMLQNNVSNIHRYFASEKREVGRELRLEPGAARVLMYNAFCHSETPSKAALAREQDEQLQTAVRQLPEQYRLVIGMHTIDGLTFVQIAEKLGNTADAVRKLWGRAIEDLAKRLETNQ
jgi:RNA polymerase sigma-70 factor (ECF subfamily)